MYFYCAGVAMIDPFAEWFPSLAHGDVLGLLRGPSEAASLLILLRVVSSRCPVVIEGRFAEVVSLNIERRRISLIFGLGSL